MLISRDTLSLLSVFHSSLSLQHLKLLYISFIYVKWRLCVMLDVGTFEGEGGREGGVVVTPC